MDDRDNLDRQPTKGEKVFGIGGALILVGVGVTGLWFSAFVKRDLNAAVIAGIFSSFAAFLLFRFVFTAATALHRTGVMIMAWVFVIGGVVTFMVGLFDIGFRNRFYLIGLGLTGVSHGLLNLARAKKMPNNKPESEGLNVNSKPDKAQEPTL